mmetsp:Transcript_21719/g.47349  ORF Transcript_21719/g.47349 Transcript_21719/m.47349 type:complete len:325 (+) Transcript_21719:101-1075(+)
MILATFNRSLHERNRGCGWNNRVLFWWILLFGTCISFPLSLAFQMPTLTTPIQNRDAHESNSNIILRAKRGGKGGNNKGGARQKGNVPDRLVEETQYVEVEPDGSDAWRCSDITDLLRRGGVGCLPTDTGYGFVTPIDSKAGLERILKMKGYLGCKKPLSLLCSDLATIDKYCYGIDRQVFKLLKGNLPGPYTFILPASSALPKMMFLDNKGGKHSWARKSLGVRMPDDNVLKYVQEELGGIPLLVSSVPNERGDGEGDGNDIEGEIIDVAQLQTCRIHFGSSWCQQVDFVVDAGEKPADGSTIYDLTEEPALLREGLGDLNLV